MARALLPKTFSANDQIFITSASGTTASDFASEFKIQFIEKSKIKNHSYDVVWLALKPQSFYELKKDEYKLNINESGLIISMLAGVKIKTIQDFFDYRYVARLMPNTPSEVGAGVNPYYCNKFSNDDLKKYFEESLSKTGIFFSLENEEKLDLVTPFTGCGPAYFFEIVRILEKDLANRGLDLKTARLMIAQTMLGASKMILESDNSPEELRINVTSKKGVTEQALLALEANKLEKIFNIAIDQAFAKIQELQK